MSEIKAYALVVPIDEMFEKWMPNPKMGELLKDLDLLGVHQDPVTGAQYLLFRNTEDRKAAYNKIHAALPDTLCAYDPRVALVDTKYLKPMA